MPEPKMIKGVANTICPHCSKKVLISFRSYFPSIDWTLKEEDLEAAKEKLKKGVEEIVFDNPKEKEKIFSWIDQEEFRVGPEEVGPMIEEIKRDNTKQEEDDIKDNKTE